MGRRVQLWGPGALKMLALLCPEEKRGWLQKWQRDLPKIRPNAMDVAFLLGLDLPGVGEATSHLHGH